MKIIHTIGSLDNEASGPSYSVSRLAELLIEGGEEVIITSLSGYDSEPNIYYRNSFSRKFLALRFPKKLGISPELNQWLKSEASQNNIDLIHNHGLWLMPNIYSGQISKQYKIPYVVSPRGMFSSEALNYSRFQKKVFWKFVQGPALDSVSCFHATSHSEFLQIRNMGFTQPVAIIPNGVDIPEHHKKSIKEERILLYLGRVHPIKGLERLLEAWKDLEELFPLWHLNIIGPSTTKYLKHIKKIVLNLGLKRANLLGPKYGPQKEEAYINADLFILPSYSENFGVSIAEALSFSIPVLASNATPWVDLDSYGAGRCIEINKSNLIFTLKELMSKSDEELSIMGSNGRKWMESHFAWTIIASKMRETYKWVKLGGDAPPWVMEY